MSADARLGGGEPQGPGVGRVSALYSLYQILFGLLLWLPVFYEYQKRIGLSDAEIFGIQSIYYLAFCFLEIPTGWLADRLGTRRCMRYAGAVLVAANLLPLVAPGYTGFLAHFLLVAAARSLNSGASSAYLYEWLRRSGREAEYARIEGRARAWGLAAKVVGWAGVGWLMNVRLELPYLATAVFAAGSWGAALLLPRLPAAPHAWKAPALSEVWAVVRDGSRLRWLMLQGVGIFVLGRIVQVNLFQPILSSKGVGLEAQGLAMSAMTLFEALGSAYPGALRRRLSDVNAVTFTTLAMALASALLIPFGAPGTLAALMLFAWAMGLAFPVQKQVMNAAIPDSRLRATLLSVESILDRLVNAGVAALMAGFVAGGRTGEFLGWSAFVTATVALGVTWGLGRGRGGRSVKDAVR